ncbi:hypothetical protein [Tatumella sp. OPLPL6]|nr:hypothetical protein [Tatumella sp. OPLPL6]
MNPSPCHATFYVYAQICQANFHYQRHLRSDQQWWSYQVGHVDR